jgi:hypothetical protein
LSEEVSGCTYGEPLRQHRQNDRNQEVSPRGQKETDTSITYLMIMEVRDRGQGESKGPGIDDNKLVPEANAKLYELEQLGTSVVYLLESCVGYYLRLFYEIVGLTHG